MSGEVFLWGSNKHGQLCGKETFLPQPTALDRSLLNGERVSALHSGWTHLIAQTGRNENVVVAHTQSVIEISSHLIAWIPWIVVYWEEEITGITKASFRRVQYVKKKWWLFYGNMRYTFSAHFTVTLSAEVKLNIFSGAKHCSIDTYLPPSAHSRMDLLVFSLWMVTSFPVPFTQ